MSVGFKNNKTLFLDTEEIYWKNLKNDKTYIFYITRKEKEFFYTNFKTSFIESGGRKIYEWEDSKNTRFRVVADRQNGGPQLPLFPLCWRNYNILF